MVADKPICKGSLAPPLKWEVRMRPGDNSLLELHRFTQDCEWSQPQTLHQAERAEPFEMEVRHQGGNLALQPLTQGWPLCAMYARSGKGSLSVAHSRSG